MKRTAVLQKDVKCSLGNFNGCFQRKALFAKRKKKEKDTRNKRQTSETLKSCFSRASISPLLKDQPAFSLCFEGVLRSIRSYISIDTYHKFFHRNRMPSLTSFSLSHPLLILWYLSSLADKCPGTQGWSQAAPRGGQGWGSPLQCPPHCHPTGTAGTWVPTLQRIHSPPRTGAGREEVQREMWGNHVR